MVLAIFPGEISFFRGERMSSRPQVAALVSALGSTAAAIYQAMLDGRLAADMPVVIASNPKAGERLRALNHPNIVVIPRSSYTDRLAFGEAILTVLLHHGVDFFGQYGWDPITPNNVLECYRNRCVNQHTDLVPYFGGEGMNGIVTVCARLRFVKMVDREYLVKPTAHWVTEVLDEGAVVKAGRVDILPYFDTCESLYERVKKEEYEVQIGVIKDLIAGRLGEVPVVSPVRPGEEEILAKAKADAIAHHSGQTQAQLKITKS